MKGCSITVRIVFIDLKAPRSLKQKKDEDYEVDSENDTGPFAPLRKKMALE